jgi:hypothetical protein
LGFPEGFFGSSAPFTVLPLAQRQGSEGSFVSFGGIDTGRVDPIGARRVIYSRFFRGRESPCCGGGNLGRAASAVLCSRPRSAAALHGPNSQNIFPFGEENIALNM